MEQNLARMTLPLIATLYLDRTNNWESVGVERRAEALSYITKGETRKKNEWNLSINHNNISNIAQSQMLYLVFLGYQNQLAYKKPDGSYPPYRREGASTW